MKWREVVSIVLRKCKWRIILTAILLTLPLIVGVSTIAKPKLTIQPLGGGSSAPGQGFPDPNIDPL